MFNTHRICIILVITFISLLLQSCSKEKTGIIDASEQEAIEIFDEIVMTHEHTGTKRPLRRWESPMKIFLYHDLPEHLDSSLVHVIDTLNSLMRISRVEIVADENKSNVQLYFTTVDEYNSLLPFADPIPKSYNGYIHMWYEKSIIQRARVFISSTLSKDYSIRVLYEEITQGLGPLTDTPNNKKSIFSSSFPDFPNNDLQLFPIDKELIRNLYSDYLLPGMTHVEVKESLEEHYMCD